MKAELLATEIAQILGCERQTIHNRAKEESWPYKEAPNPSGGGFARYFYWDELPAKMRRKILEKKLECESRFIPANNTIDEAQLKAFMTEWEKAPDWNRKRAGARFEILQAIKTFCNTNGYKQTQGEEIFVALYRSKKAPGIENWVYQAEKSLSVAKVRRMRAAFRKKALVGLLTQYKPQFRDGKAVTPEMQIFILTHYRQNPQIRPAHIYRLVEKVFDPAPGKRTIYRFMARWKREHPALTAMIDNPKWWKNNLMPAFGDASARAEHLGHIVEIDSTPADVMTADGQRCAIIAAIDVFSRKMVVIVAPTSKSIAVAACIRKMLLMVGIFAILIKDNGPDYASLHVESILTCLMIQAPKLPPYTPEAKPHIERALGTFAKGLLELLEGFTGHSVAERQAIRERQAWASKMMTPGDPVKAPFTLAQLQAASDQWIDQVYHNAPHKGLNGKTPNEQALESGYYPQKIRDERVLDILLAPVSRPRKVLKKGISLGGSYFIAPELVEHIGKRVECRRDLTNAGLLYVYNLKERKFICKATNDALKGESLEAYMAAKKRHAGELKRKARALGYLGRDSRSAIQILLEDQVENPPQKITPLHPEADSPEIREARKAAYAAEKPADTEMDEPGNVKPFPTTKIMDPVDTNAWLQGDRLDQAFKDAMENSRRRKRKIV